MRVLEKLEKCDPVYMRKKLMTKADRRHKGG
jgi:hypothetical protein